MNTTISPFPYYGGKARMAEFIAERLDYDSTSVYIEPFGGAARVLLNKPRHDVEIYSDYSKCLSIFFDVMTDKVKTEELIEKLLDKCFLPTPELFYDAYLTRAKIDDPVLTDLEIESKQIISEYSIVDGNLKPMFVSFKKALQRRDYPTILKCYEHLLRSGIVTNEKDKLWIQGKYDEYNEFWENVRETYEQGYEEYDIKQESEEIQNKLKKMQEEKPKQYEKELAQKKHERGLYKIDYEIDYEINDYELSELDDIDIAAYTFILHYCSRDGMGTYWSQAKVENKNRYYKAVSNLRRVSERMQGVEVRSILEDGFESKYLLERETMMYLDPSYLKVDEEKDLGEVYKAHYDFESHKDFLERITKPDVKAKIMISNYNSELYNTMLEGWRKVEFETFTSVGLKASKRTECIWTNY